MFNVPWPNLKLTVGSLPTYSYENIPVQLNALAGWWRGRVRQGAGRWRMDLLVYDCDLGNVGVSKKIC